jgi:hypothetical protein
MKMFITAFPHSYTQRTIISSVQNPADVRNVLTNSTYKHTQYTCLTDPIHPRGSQEEAPHSLPIQSGVKTVLLAESKSHGSKNYKTYSYYKADYF